MGPDSIARLRGTSGIVLVLLFTAIAYAPSLDNLLVYDDHKIVRAVSDTGQVNPMVSELRPIGEYFTTEYWTGTGADSIASNPLYRPITVWSFALTHAILPGDGSLASEAWPHHLVNLLLHLANTLLVFFVTRTWMGRDSFGPVLAAAAFGLAAIHTEAVVAVVGRADLLACGFGLGAWLSMGRSFGRNAAAAVLMWLAFCSKESALAWWPFLVCVGAAAAWRSGAFSWRALLPPILLGLLPFAVWFLLRANAFADLPPAYLVAFVSNPLRDMDTMPRILAALLVQGFAMVKMIAPYPLSCDYGACVFGFAKPGGSATFTDWLYLLPLCAALGLAVFAILRRHTTLFLGSAAALGFAFATSNLPFVIGTIWGERLAYLPSLGVAILLAGWFTVWFDRPAIRRRAGILIPILTLVYLLANGAITFARADDWQDDATLFTTDSATYPDSLALAMQAAIQLRNRGDITEWRRKLEHAIAIEPEWARGYIELGAGAFNDAGLGAPTEPRARQAHMAAKLEESRRWLTRALEARIIEKAEKSMAWRNYAVLMLQRGNKAKALAYLDKILAHDPQNVISRHQILDDVGRAFPVEEFDRILQGGEAAAPGLPIWQLHRGLRAARREDFSGAQSHLEAALPRITLFDRTVQNAWFVLAQLRAKAGDGAGSRELFGRIATDMRFAPDLRQAAEKSR